MKHKKLTMIVALVLVVALAAGAGHGKYDKILSLRKQ